MARAIFKAELYGPSLDAIERALSLNPQNFAALRGLGILFESIGEEDRALFAYRAAIAIHPHMEDVAASINRLSSLQDGQKI